MIRDSLGEEKSNMYIERGKKSIALLKEILAIPSVNGADKILEEIDLSSGSLLMIGEPTGCKLGVAQKGCIWGI